MAPPERKSAWRPPNGTPGGFRLERNAVLAGETPRQSRNCCVFTRTSRASQGQARAGMPALPSSLYEGFAIRFPWGPGRPRVLAYGNGAARNPAEFRRPVFSRRRTLFQRSVLEGPP